jgi:hypothetical protein
MEALACAKTAFTHIIRHTENRRPCIKPQLRACWTFARSEFLDRVRRVHSAAN